MTIEQLQEFFGWCLVMNFGMLMVWAVMFLCCKDFIYKTHSMWFKIPRDRFDEILYCFMGGYKLLVIVFVMMPYIALCIMS